MEIQKFKHIYIEKDIIHTDEVQRLLKHFPNANQIIIHHYKDVFNRSKQNYMMQHASQNLILARKEGQLVYEGAPVCQNFGNQYFYYTSCIMNCIYDCEYCYLKGMYPSGNMVIFVNMEDVFHEVEALLEKHPVYLCVSYDTDLMPLEGLTGFVQKWCEFVKKHSDLTIEVRTKCGSAALWEQLPVLDCVIYAFTLSPERVVREYEHGTSSLKQRISCIKTLMQMGHSVRLCFDPMIYCENWKQEYECLLQDVDRLLCGSTMENRQNGECSTCVENSVKKAPSNRNILDISVGSFRVSKDYLKKMRKQEPNSSIVQFPYDSTDGVYHYPEKLMEEMENFLVERLEKMFQKDKIFRWKS